MNSYFIESFKIKKLWGYQDIDLSFDRKVNVLIGPNASGKTTVLNFIHSMLSADLPSLLKFSFDRAEIKLRGFKDRSVRTVTMERDVADGFSELSLGKKRLPINIDAIFNRRFLEHYPFSERGNHAKSTLIRAAATDRLSAEEFYDELTTLVPIVWLPVSRRLSVTEDEEERYTRAEPLEPVDLRLRELLESLSRYHSGLNALLSKRYKEFENQVLSVILYSKEHDRIDLILNSIPSSLPTKSEKKQLMGAFDAAGLLNEHMQSRIEDHFAEAEKVGRRISENVRLELEDILVVPLISRTKDMVKYAGELEKDRESIFAPLRLYEETVNSFLNEKSVKVDERGKLEIRPSPSSDKVDERGKLEIESSLSCDLDPRLLSSGEKQILILLTQALLRVDKPVVYIADEPELSLHVTWQEKLLESLVTLSKQMQVIVATHSPDIVGKFQDKVIDLGRES